METPLVSICCITYNHSPFIRQCLDGFIMQKTNFPIEVLIHDDASTDDTADIIREYEQKYPEIIKPIYQTENQYSKGVKISLTYNYSRVQGKYIAICEGDDYWTDEYKLQKQVDFMEANEDFSICFHPIDVYIEEEKKLTKNYTVPEVPDVTDIKKLAMVNYINTVSVVYRYNKQVFDDLYNFPKLPVGDYCLHMLFAKYGKIKKLADTMAVYRIHKSGTWSLKPIEYTYPIWLKLLVGLIYHFIEDREICNILIEQYRRHNTPEHPDFIPKNATLFFNTGNGYSVEEKYNFYIIGDEAEISCQIPENTISIRLDPIKDYGCIVSNPEILSSNGIVKYEPINGYKSDNGDMVFINTDPQIELNGAEQWINIKYHIFPLTDLSPYEIFGNLIAERDILLNSRSWRITKPLRNFTTFVRSHKVLYLFAKGLLSLKRNGIIATIKKIIKKIIKYKQEQTYKKSLQFIALPKFVVLPQSERLSQKNTIFPKQIKISIITPLYNTPKKFLREMIHSVKEQTYSNWELCLADGSDDKHKKTSRICNAFAKEDKRIKYKKLNKNLGISKNSNEAMDMSTGEYIGILDHDDVLHPSALYEIMKVICNEDADFIYTDEATFDTSNNLITKHYKPDFAIDTLRSCNYICHFTVFSRKIMDQAGKFRSEYDGSQDHDLFLRYTDVATKIYHIPQLLYFWRIHKNSVASDIGTKTYAIEAGKNVVRDHLLEHGISAKIESTKVMQTFYRINYDLIEQPLISIIIPNKDHVPLLQSCLSSIKEKTTYSNHEIIIVENNSIEDATFTYYEELKKQTNINVVYWKEKGFNYSKINNYGVQYAHGQHLVFLNNDVEIITPNWIEKMLMFSQRSDVGAVGIKLYFPDDTIQHAGIIIGMWGIAGHIYYGTPRDNIGYMGRLHIAQNMSAVTAACMMIKKSIFDEVGGFLPEFYASWNDVDLCLRIRDAGYLIVWTPFAEAYHHESKTRGYYNTPEKQREFSKEIDKFKAKWDKELAAGDPYYNCNLSLDRVDYSEK
jgi:glycosyltransferase involved in cell wall biosynthesis